MRHLSGYRWGQTARRVKASCLTCPWFANSANASTVKAHLLRYPAHEVELRALTVTLLRLDRQAV